MFTGPSTGYWQIQGDSMSQLGTKTTIWPNAVEALQLIGNIRDVIPREPAVEVADHLLLRVS